MTCGEISLQPVCSQEDEPSLRPLRCAQSQFAHAGISTCHLTAWANKQSTLECSSTAGDARDAGDAHDVTLAMPAMLLMLVMLVMLAMLVVATMLAMLVKVLLIQEAGKMACQA